jgi:hypothetical protein
MNPHQIEQLLQQLAELAMLDDPAFTARTQSKRIFLEAHETIRALLQENRRLNEQLSGGRTIK